MNEVLAKIIARKNQPTKKVDRVSESESPVIESAAVAPAVVDQFEPCSSCGSAIRWLNAAAIPRCIGCQPPKFASLVRSKEVLVVRNQSTGERAWERLVAIQEGGANGRHRGRLLSETGIRELISRGELDPLTAAGVGVGGSGEGVVAAGEVMIGDEIQLARAADQFDQWRELSEAEMERFFESQKQQLNQKQGAAT